MEYCNGMMYAVKEGDTLYSISMKYNIPLALLLRANPYVDVYNLQVGETICVPVRKAACCQGSDQGQNVWSRGDSGQETGMENSVSQEVKPEVDEMEMIVDPRTKFDPSTYVSISSEDQPANKATEENTGAGSREQEREEQGDRPNGKVCCIVNMEGKAVDRDQTQWERYVTQPGDTLDIVMENVYGKDQEDMGDVLEEFVEKNGMGRIYLLPGIAYYRQK